MEEEPLYRPGLLILLRCLPDAQPNQAVAVGRTRA